MTTTIKSLLTLLIIITLCLFTQFVTVIIGDVYRQAEELRQKDVQIESMKETCDEVEKARKEIKRVRKIKSAELIKISAQIVAASYEFKIPAKEIMLCANAETEFHPAAVGPCGEHGMIQVMRGTFYAILPKGDFEDRDQCFVAGMMYLKECWELSGHREIATLAMYNAGNGRGVEYAMGRAWKHVSRCRTILRRMGA